MPVQGFYDAEFAPWAAGMRRIGTMIAAQPVMQANAQARQQQTQTQAAHQSLLGAQTQHAETQTQELIKKGQLVDALQRAAQQAQQDFANGVTDSPAVREFTGAASALTGLNGDDIAKNMKQGIGTILARQGKVSEAADVTDPVAMEKNRGDIASREKIAGERGVILTPGSGQWKNGVQVANQPSAASQAQASYETTTETIPASEGSPEVPADSGKRSLFGIDALAKDVPPTPGKPAVPPTYEKKRTRRVLLGDAINAPMANQSQDPNDTEDATDPGGPEEQGEPTSPLSSTSYSMKATTPTAAAAPEAPVASAPSFAEKVRVQHPDGRTGMIPKAQLKAAIAQGYKLAQ